MAGVPTNFQAISNVLPTYQFIDLAAGTGLINFYAGDTCDLSLLSNTTFYAETVSTVATLPQNAAAKLLDVNYDVTLNRPLVIYGRSVLNVPVALLSSSVSPSAIYCYIVATFRKWNGAETDIYTNTSNTFSASAATVPSYKMLAIDMTIPLTLFKIGETMRLTIEYWGYYTAGAAGTITGSYGHDPMNRSAGWDSTGAVPSRLVYQVPVRLNL
jgi:hypothetical protein